MATKKQIAANRRNARKSTGPRTEEGKERSSQNAVKHGLTSRRAVLADEDPKQFLEFRIEVHEDLGPMGGVETTLANRIAAQMWRLARVPAIEAEMMDALRTHPEEGGGLAAAWDEDESTYGGSLARLSRYEVALERSLTRMLKEFHRLQDRRLKRDAAEMAQYEHESDRYVPGGMEALDRNPDGSYPKPQRPGGQGGAGGGGRAEAGLRNEPDSGGESVGIHAFRGIPGDDGT
ncbi:MAG: hypothetical protein FVQ81_18725 [Candidatus Glassbacteria bacterium]|nr:hypothetical protein [Candidatus Glassbacteria bacterium]